jgi:hypothetical protein
MAYGQGKEMTKRDRRVEKEVVVACSLVCVQTLETLSMSASSSFACLKMRMMRKLRSCRVPSALSHSFVPVDTAPELYLTWNPQCFAIWLQKCGLSEAVHTVLNPLSPHQNLASPQCLPSSPQKPNQILHSCIVFAEIPYNSDPTLASSTVKISCQTSHSFVCCTSPKLWTCRVFVRTFPTTIHSLVANPNHATHASIVCVAT